MCNPFGKSIRMKRISDMLLVVHVPKTAGTSFRHALDMYFGAAQVVRDYGHNFKETTDVVRTHLYVSEERKSERDLVQAISDSSKKVLIGHFPVRKYVDYFEPQNVIGFARDPLIRTCSEYMHRMREASYEGSFSDFIKEDSIRNIQTRYLRGMPEQSVIGLTEQYRESLLHINESLQLNLSVLKRNIDRKGGGRKFAESLSSEEIELFNDINQKDIDFFERVTERFDTLNIPKTVAMRIANWRKNR